MLGFQTKAEVLWVAITVGPQERAPLEIRREELYSRLGGEDFHRSTGIGICDSGTRATVSGLRLIEHKTMIVTAIELLFGDL